MSRLTEELEKIQMALAEAGYPNELIIEEGHRLVWCPSSVDLNVARVVHKAMCLVQSRNACCFGCWITRHGRECADGNCASLDECEGTR